jgi:hypothetical protein
VKLDAGCDEPEEVEPEGEPDVFDSPADEPPPAVEEPLEVFLLPDCFLFGHEDEEEEEDEERERSSVGRGPAGTASESRNTSPRMCSTYWEGTPDC